MQLKCQSHGEAIPVGEWLSRDPIGEGHDATLYTYVRNDPICLIDLLGLCGGATWITPGAWWDYNPSMGHWTWPGAPGAPPVWVPDPPLSRLEWNQFMRSLADLWPQNAQDWQNALNAVNQAEADAHNHGQGSGRKGTGMNGVKISALCEED